MTDEQREQRRYEIAKAVATGLAADNRYLPASCKEFGTDAVRIADALLAALEKEPTDA